MTQRGRKASGLFRVIGRNPQSLEIDRQISDNGAMARFYVETALPALPAVVSLDRDQAHHARKVLRLSPGDQAELWDGQGGIAVARLMGGSNSSADFQLLDVTRYSPLRPRLTLAAAMPKGPRADEMVNQLSQAGVDRLIPLRTQRSVVDPRDAKLERLAKLAIESGKQCHRPWKMEVSPVMTLQAVFQLPADVRLMADPSGERAAEIESSVRQATDVLLLIGPEGGWTDDERAMAKQADVRRWRIAPHVLRIETAAAAAAAIVRYLTMVYSSGSPDIQSSTHLGK